ncbi:MAG: nicotinamide riboside transporter PnuC [Sediminibacterium sp.]|nr:nicotinamide riboside transporter PnuC [Sediminibacterium sp.]
MEIVAVIFGVFTVWLNKLENIWGFPLGMINTILYVVICFNSSLFGESAVNLYYTLVAMYGWYLWSKKKGNTYSLQISSSSGKDWLKQIIFFLISYSLLVLALHYLKDKFYPNSLPYLDGLASASAFTAMWLLAKKKLENWLWWILTNICSIMLFLYKGLWITSIQFLIYLVIAVWSYIDWHKKVKILNKHKQ